MGRDTETYRGTDHDNTEPYHVMMTLRWEWNGTHRGTWSGTIQVVDGTSRHDVMARALVTACAALDVPGKVRNQVVVTAWELAPDTIHVPAAGPDPVTDDALVEQMIRIVGMEPGIHAVRAVNILKDYTGDRDPYHILNVALSTGRIEYKGNLSDWTLVPVVRTTESASTDPS